MGLLCCAVLPAVGPVAQGHLRHVIRMPGVRCEACENASWGFPGRCLVGWLPTLDLAVCNKASVEQTYQQTDASAAALLLSRLAILCLQTLAKPLPEAYWTSFKLLRVRYISTCRLSCLFVTPARKQHTIF